MYNNNVMPTLLQINTTANWGSTGRIAEEIGKIAISKGWDSYIAYGRGKPQSQSHLIRIGNDWDMYNHIIQSRLFDNHGLASKSVTEKFITQVEQIKPDIIHLHNIHGYYLNYEILFSYLSSINTPVIWTLHDCWAFTGHCGYYDFINCHKWMTHCEECPNKCEYPKSLFLDRSSKHFELKRKLFSNSNIVLVCVSKWLAGQVKQSFLKDLRSEVIHNGIDIDTFPLKRTINKKSENKLILGVASVWHKRKGLDEFVKLCRLLPNNYRILLVGVSNHLQAKLPERIECICRTNSIQELANYYASADVFVNPTIEDNYPTTNIEALATGTPVITYNTGGSAELITVENGIVVEKGNIAQLAQMIQSVCNSPMYNPIAIRKTVIPFGQKEYCYSKYFKLYSDLRLG